MSTVTLSRRALLVGVAAAAAAEGCGGGCPKPGMPEEAYDEWARQLDARRVLSLNPSSPISIKRDVHNLEVSADARDLANAFHAVMRDPNRRFGLIRVNRKREFAGKPFALGERFQGRYSIEDAIREKLDARWRKIFGDLADDAAIRNILCRIENESTSDYGIIARLELSPPAGRAHVLQYRYLEGSPISGSSTFVVVGTGVRRSRLTQIFEYQEQDLGFATFFSAGGLKLHNQVVYSQTSQAAELVGAKIVSTDVPKAYQEI